MSKTEMVEMVRQFTESMMATANEIGQKSAFSDFFGDRVISAEDVAIQADKLAVMIRANA